jgi:8-oxo-dGTP pyrophosphatase MutT (NUDIX family)
MNAASLRTHPEAAAVPPLLRSLAEVLEARSAGYGETPEGHSRRPAGVLVLFYHRGESLHVVCFRRTETVPTHKGQVSFPGGSADPGDGSLLNTALRESQEELTIDTSRVIVLGALKPFDTFVSNFVVSPFVGYYLERDPVFVPTDFEVAEVLEVPVDELREKRNRHRGRVPGFAVPIPLPYYKVGSAIIWGATGGIVEELINALAAAEAALPEGGAPG